MKRTPLKRRTSYFARGSSRSRAASPSQRTAELARVTRLKSIGARAKRDQPTLEAFRRDVLERAGHQCERCGSRRGVQAHHLLPRSRGGTHKRENGAALCATCHGRVHDHTVQDWARWIR